MTNSTLALYGIPLSGHCHRAALMLSLLDLPYEYRNTPDFLDSPVLRSLNPLGQIPVLMDGTHVLPDSNAILVYLAKRYDPTGTWYPEDPLISAQIQRWLSFAAGEVRFGPALARVICVFGFAGDLANARTLAARALTFMDGHLAQNAYLAHSSPTIADVACYAYVAHAPEGGVSLDAYPNIRAWISRVEAWPRFIPMPSSPRPAI